MSDFSVASCMDVALFKLLIASVKTLSSTRIAAKHMLTGRIRYFWLSVVFLFSALLHDIVCGTNPNMAVFLSSFAFVDQDGSCVPYHSLF